jgi:hypothetical protein
MTDLPPVFQAAYDNRPGSPSQLEDCNLSASMSMRPATPVTHWRPLYLSACSAIRTDNAA